MVFTCIGDKEDSCGYDVYYIIYVGLDLNIKRLTHLMTFNASGFANCSLQRQCSLLLAVHKQNQISVKENKNGEANEKKGLH